MTLAHAAAAARDGGDLRAGEAPRAPSDRWQRFIRLIAPQRGLLGASFALLLVHSACRLAQPWLVMTAIDGYLVPASPAAPFDLSGFRLVAFAFLGVAALEMVARWAQQVTLDVAGQRALLRLRRDVFAHLQRLPASFHDKTPTGRLVGRVTTDVEALQELFASGVVTVVGDFVFLGAALWLLLSLSPPLTGATMLIVPVLIVTTALVRGRVRTAYSAMRSRLSQLNGFLHENVAGMGIVQLFGQQARHRGQFDEINGGVRDAQLRSVRWESILSAATEMLGSFTIAVILWYGGGLALAAAVDAPSAGAAALTLGTLFAFVDYMQKFFVPLNDLSMKYTVLQNALVAGDRIFALLDEPTEPVDRDDAVSSRGPGRVEFRDVTFGYDPDQPVLHDVSFRIEPGETVALVGATGSGKSTILSLLTRLYDVQSGAVALDDADVTRLARDDVRRRVGVVPQDPFLFHGTILDNVRIGRPDVDAVEARAAADRLHLDEVARRFPGGYDEPIAERGKNLSAGERQLVAFARMLVRAPEVLLLDEATANVDTHTEQLLQDAVRRLMDGRTAIIVAHRLATIRDADRILVLHKGRLVEQGRHDELLARRGTYWRLYQLQFADQAAD